MNADRQPPERSTLTTGRQDCPLPRSGLRESGPAEETSPESRAMALVRDLTRLMFAPLLTAKHPAPHKDHPERSD